jgi:hypothetical protein
MKVDRKVNRTYLGFEIFVPGIFGEAKKFDWPKYFDACRQNLYRIGAEQSLEILCWSVEPNEERESICHAIAVRSALEGCLPVRLTRALRPPKGYSIIDFLARSLQKNWRIEQILKGHVEAQRLQRYDRNGKRLREPIPSQLLARAILESDWRMLRPATILGRSLMP